MHAFTVHPQKAPPAPTEEETPRRRWRRLFALALLLLGIGGLVWAVRPDPRMSRAQSLQKELFGPDSKNLSPEERKARFAEYREQVKHLNDDQKWELSAPMREKQRAEMDRYVALSAKDKLRYLDERIDKSEKMRKDREKQKTQGKAGPPGGGFGFGGPPGGNKAGGPGGGKGGGGPGGKSPEEIQQRKKQALERTTPEERAKRDQFRKNLAEKMLTYAIGRGLEHYDKCSVDDVIASLKQGQDRFSTLIMGVVMSEPFQKRRGSMAAAK